MSIISGITFYRPSISTTRRYIQDSAGYDMEARDDVTITDVVFHSDLGGSGSLINEYHKILEKAKDEPKVNISYRGVNGYGNIKSVSCLDDSDFVNLLHYTITVDAIPSDANTLNFRNYSYNSNTETPLNRTSQTVSYYDQSGTLTSATLYNKPTSYSQTWQYSLENGHIGGTGLKALEKAEKYLTTNICASLRGQYISSITKSSSENGTHTIVVKSQSTPGSDIGKYILLNTNTSDSYNFDGKYSDVSTTMTFSSLGPNLDGYYVTSGDFANKVYALDITGVPTGQSVTPFEFASGVMEYYKSGNFPWPSVGANDACWNLKSMSIVRDWSKGSAQLIINTTTQNLGNCDLNGYKIDYSISSKSKNTIVDVGGWSHAGYYVQDLSSSSETEYNYNISVEDTLSCPPGAGSGLKAYATGIFGDIDLANGSGQITSYVLKFKNRSCTLDVTQYLGSGLSTTGIGYEASP